MRTTVELDDELRARLLSLAARRGEKGFSRLVNEAVTRYLDEVDRERDMRRAALRLQGALSADEATELREATAELRRHRRGTDDPHRPG